MIRIQIHILINRPGRRLSLKMVFKKEDLTES